MLIEQLKFAAGKCFISLTAVVTLQQWLTQTVVVWQRINVFSRLQVLECGVCEDVFSLQGDKVPRLLLCGHTVCHDCLTRLPLHGRAVRCPFDRQVTELGEFITAM